jgi:uncharacterized protein (DUF2062 family)
MFSTLRHWSKRFLIDPIRTLLTQGVTPEKIAWGVALATAVSICPILGLPSILCTFLAMALRLNLPLMQVVNYLFTVPQWALIIPFLRAGEALFGAEAFPLSIEELRALFDSDFWRTAMWFWRSALYAGFVWLLTVPFVTAATFLFARHWIRQLRDRFPLGREKA